MRRREFITLLSGAAVSWPLSASAQQAALPMVGFLRPTRAEESGQLVAAVRQGLRESGYPNDKVVVETRWANGQLEQIPRLVAELLALQVSVIVANIDAALAAEKATISVPSFSSPGPIQSQRDSSPALIGQAAISLASASILLPLPANGLNCCVS